MRFSEFAQQHNINLKQINATDHCIKRCKERLGWQTLKDSQIVGNLRAMLGKSVYIGEVVDDDERKKAHLFASDRRAMYISGDLTCVITVTKHDSVTYNPIKRAMLDLHQKEIRKLTRKENARIKRLRVLRDDCDVDLALLKRRSRRTKSEAVRNACIAKGRAIRQTIAEYEKEIEVIQNEKRAISRSMVSIIT